MVNLTNRWMNNPTYLASMAHIGWACSIILSTFIFGGLYISLIILGGGLCLAAIKEFFYDARYEIPKQTNFDNWLDFSMYAVGGIIGIIIILIKHFLFK